MIGAPPRWAERPERPPAPTAHEIRLRWIRSMVPFALLGWWLFTVLTDGTLQVRNAVWSTDRSADGAVAATQSGSLSRQVGVTLFFVIGAIHLPSVTRRLTASPLFRRRIVGLVAPFALYGAWAALTLVWTTDLPLSIRRYAQLVLLIVGAIGLGAGYYGTIRDGAAVFARHVVIAGSLIGAWVWIQAPSTVGVRLFDPSWSLLSPSVGWVVAHPLSMSIVACIYLAFGRRTGTRLRAPSNPAFWLSIAFLQLLTIFALRKRMSFALTILVAAVYLLVVLWPQHRARNVAVLAFLGASLLVVAVDLAAPVEIVEAALPVASRDLDLDTATTLNGRIPLWQALVPYIEERPLTGHGYGAFWSSRRLPQVQDDVGWPAVVGHNGFIDEALGTGYIGVVLIGAAFLAGMVGAFIVARRERLVEATFVGFVVMMFLTGNLTETILQVPTKTLFITAMVALAALPAWRAGETPRAA